MDESWRFLLCGLEELQDPLLSYDDDDGDGDDDNDGDNDGDNDNGDDVDDGNGDGGGDDDGVDDDDDECKFSTGWFIRLLLRHGSIWIFSCIVHFKCSLSIITLVIIIRIVM